jgi:DNA-binding NarL/FixJ family response regulator
MTAKCFHEQFEALLPKIKESARFAFRGLNPSDREEAEADLIAASWSAWSGLIKKGRSPLEVGPMGILTNAIRYVRSGRRVGNPGSGRGRMDLWNHRSQRALGFRRISLASARRQGELRSWVAKDHRSTPADHAVFLIDFEDWLGRLSERRRLSAELLSQGYGTKEVAHQLGVSAGAISQARTELARNWASFQQDRTV